MGNTIYLISILDKINKISFVLVAILTAVLIFGIIFYFDNTGTWLDSEEKALEILKDYRYIFGHITYRISDDT